MGKKKVLIIAEDKESRNVMRDRIMNIMRYEDVDCLVTPYMGALDVFEKQKPNIVIVCDYTHTGSLVKSRQMFNELNELAKQWQLVIAIGEGKPSRNCSNYIIHPSGETPIAKAEESLRTSLRSLLMA